MLHLIVAGEERLVSEGTEGESVWEWDHHEVHCWTGYRQGATLAMVKYGS